MDQELEILKEIKELLKNPADPKKAIVSLIEEKNQLQKQIDELNQQQGSALKKDLINKVEDINGIKVITQEVKLPDANVLKQLSFELKNEVPNLVAVLAANLNEKPMLSVILMTRWSKSLDSMLRKWCEPWRRKFRVVVEVSHFMPLRVVRIWPDSLKRLRLGRKLFMRN